MKKKLTVLPLLLATLSMTGCRFEEIFSAVTSIEIVDYRNAYHTSHSFKGKNELVIEAYYSTGKVKQLSINDVTPLLTYGSSKIDVNSPFGSEGTYTFKVSSGKVFSNSIELNVYSEFNYISNITFSDSVLELDQFATKRIEFTVSPTNYNVDLEFSSDGEVISINRVDGNYLDITGLEEGNGYFKVSGLKDSSSTFEARQDVKVNYVCDKAEIKQTMKDYFKWQTICPSKGNVKLLVIPLWFSDSNRFINTDSKKTALRNDIETAYFGNISGFESVSSFYRKESEGQLTLTGTVTDWYEVNKPVSYYGKDNTGTYSTNTGALILEATSWYFRNHPYDDRGNYDSDSDGYIDGVIMIYAAPDCYATSDTTYRTYDNLWAYKYCTDASKDVEYPNAKVYFWASYDFMYGATTTQLKYGNSYASGDTSHVSIDAHTYIHEMGHVLGLDDYYDYSKQYNPAGGFSMQDYNVGGHDPFSLMSYGWINPYVPERKNVTIRLRSFQEHHEVVLLTPEWNSYDSPFDEYLLLELYTPTGLNKFDTDYRYNNNYPAGTKAVGIRLWHVDARLTYYLGIRNNWSEDLFVNTSEHPNNQISFAFANTYYKEGSSSNNHLSLIYSSTKSYYQEYKLLQLIRNNKDASYRSPSDDYLNSNHLFKAGDHFSMSQYGSQFYHSGKLNKNIDLNWSFEVSEIATDVNGEYYATINFAYLG